MLMVFSSVGYTQLGTALKRVKTGRIVSVRFVSSLTRLVSFESSPPKKTAMRRIVAVTEGNEMIITIINTNTNTNNIVVGIVVHFLLLLLC